MKVITFFFQLDDFLVQRRYLLLLKLLAPLEQNFLLDSGLLFLKLLFFQLLVSY